MKLVLEKTSSSSEVNKTTWLVAVRADGPSCHGLLQRREFRNELLHSRVEVLLPCGSANHPRFGHRNCLGSRLVGRRRLALQRGHDVCRGTTGVKTQRENAARTIVRKRSIVFTVAQSLRHRLLLDPGQHELVHAEDDAPL